MLNMNYTRRRSIKGHKFGVVIAWKPPCLVRQTLRWRFVSNIEILHNLDVTTLPGIGDFAVTIFADHHNAVARIEEYGRSGKIAIWCKRFGRSPFICICVLCLAKNV